MIVPFGGSSGGPAIGGKAHGLPDSHCCIALVFQSLTKPERQAAPQAKQGSAITWRDFPAPA
jgi:hypothetical protein